MTRRWFGKVIGAIAAACGLPAVATPRQSRVGLDSILVGSGRAWCGVTREGIKAGTSGWVDIDAPKNRNPSIGYLRATKAENIFDIDLPQGSRVVVSLANRIIGTQMLISMSEFPDATEDGSLERGWQ